MVDEPAPVASHDPGRRHRIRAGADVARARVGDARTRLEAKRPTNRGIDAGFRWVQLQVETGAALIAGAIAFRVFLFLLPWVFVVVFGLGVGADAVGADPRTVARSLGIAGLAATAVSTAADTSTLTQWITVFLALVGLGFGAVNLLRVLVVSHALIWRVPAKRPSHLMLSTLSIIGVLRLGNLLMVVAGRAGLVERIVETVLISAAMVGLWAAGSLRVFPHPEGAGWRDVIPGAVVFAVGIQFLQVMTVVWFAPYLQSKSETYGAIGAAFAILFWAYLLGRVITAGAALNAVLWAKREEHPAL